MKKLKLKALELGAKEVLSRDQLKKVLGGFAAAGCSVSIACPNGETKSCSCQSGTCSSSSSGVTCDCDLPGGSDGSGPGVIVTLSCGSGSGANGSD